MCFFFFFNDTATTEIYTLSLHDALPILHVARELQGKIRFASSVEFRRPAGINAPSEMEEHTSELQSHVNLVCRLLLEKKKKKNNTISNITYELYDFTCSIHTIFSPTKCT